MDPKTLEALKTSIESWKLRASTGKLGTIGTYGCALCGLFHEQKPPCIGCPVRDRTGLEYCRGTPFDWFENNRLNKSLMTPDNIKAHALLEVEFLCSLLLPDETI